MTKTRAEGRCSIFLHLNFRLREQFQMYVFGDQGTLACQEEEEGDDTLRRGTQAAKAGKTAGWIFASMSTATVFTPSASVQTVYPAIGISLQHRSPKMNV